MISIPKIYFGKNTKGDYLRYRDSGANIKKPIVVWNCTQKCNLDCVHCYSNSDVRPADNELNTNEAKKMVDDLAKNNIPVLLFSGGEPLLRDDILELISYAKLLGIRPVLSTNGTLINKKTAKQLKVSGADYVGISIDGSEKTNDSFRQKRGAFKKAVNAVANCKETGLRTGLRMTVTSRNLQDLDNIFELIMNYGINRICFYHLVNAGRADKKYFLSHEETRQFINKLVDFTREAMAKIPQFDLLTVDNPVDGPYLYMKLLSEDPARAIDAYRLLGINGGGLNSSGVGIACIDSRGNVHPDQFWRDYSLGNIKKTGFGKLWFSSKDHLLSALRDRTGYLQGRCNSCIWLNICGGGFRVRAKNTYGDYWKDDPLCYLTDEEITRAPQPRGSSLIAI